jgi:hypothetical protein
VDVQLLPAVLTEELCRKATTYASPNDCHPSRREVILR